MLVDHEEHWCLTRLTVFSLVFLRIPSSTGTLRVLSTLPSNTDLWIEGPGTTLYWLRTRLDRGISRGTFFRCRRLSSRRVVVKDLTEEGGKETEEWPWRTLVEGDFFHESKSTVCFTSVNKTLISTKMCILSWQKSIRCFYIINERKEHYLYRVFLLFHLV